jgi:DNA invertase Pin-like site-specific DNA recombinase
MRREFDVVIAEALHRLSRDLEDTAALFKRLAFHQIRIVTISEGDVTKLHIGLKGVMNDQFLEELAIKTRRGQRGRIESAKSAGGISYGYRVVPGQLGDRESTSVRLRSSAAFSDCSCPVNPRRRSRKR